jgi:hypothetical protein
MTEDLSTTAGWASVAGKVLNLSHLTPSQLTTSKHPLPIPYRSQKDKLPRPEFKKGDLVFNMKDQDGRESVQVGDQTVASADEWTGTYTITSKPEARGGKWWYSVQPGRHEPGRVLVEEGLLVDAQMEREAGWTVKLEEVPFEEGSILEGRIEGGRRRYYVRFGVNESKWVGEGEILL